MTQTPAADAAPSRFSELGLRDELLAALDAVGYESPSPIQAATIPCLMAGRDLLGQAQTGTGKTAAFALPILHGLDVSRRELQCLVLAPTRELAIQVAEAFQRYAIKMPGFHVLPIYGGQSYKPQLDGLRRGAHVVVGTPGRVIDHLKRGTLSLDNLRWLVLDEADEMLRMGFIDDVELVLKSCPEKRQLALFSATLPPAIRRIAQTYLVDAEEISIRATTTTAIDIRQRYAVVAGPHKLEALTRVLETEDFDGMIVFTRTKQATEELAERLQARGFQAAAIHGDIVQAQRERCIARLKDGQIDILVATDVAARGLDVERVSHVVNYDVPYDVESYVHRIGRTGRAGRKGDAILFITPRERHMLRLVEKATQQPVHPMDMPSVEAVNDRRIDKFKQRISETLDGGNLAVFRALVSEFVTERDLEPLDVAAALACLAQGDSPLLLDARQELPAFKPGRPEREERGEPRPRRDSPARERSGPARETRPASDAGMQTYRLAVGHEHRVKPGNIVGAIANEAGLESRFIGRIEIRDDHTLVDLPEGMPDDVLHHLSGVWVAGQQLKLRPWSESSAPPPRGPRKPRPAAAGEQERPRKAFKPKRRD